MLMNYKTMPEDEICLVLEGTSCQTLKKGDLISKAKDGALINYEVGGWLDACDAEGLNFIVIKNTH